jgi:hypothetical protein
MSAYDWTLSAGAPLCTVADSFYRTVRETIFQQLTTETTAAQWQAAQESLTRLRDESQQDIYPMHYGSLVGRHRCLDQVFREAVARLRGLQIMQPAPQPPPPPSQQVITREGIVRDVEEKIQTSTAETDLGSDAKLPDIRRDG